MEKTCSLRRHTTVPEPRRVRALSIDPACRLVPLFALLDRVFLHRAFWSGCHVDGGSVAVSGMLHMYGLSEVVVDGYCLAGAAFAG